MGKRKSQIGTEIDVNELDKMSTSMKQHLIELGYKPYVMEDGRIRWLNAEQFSYKNIKYGVKSKFRLHKAIWLYSIFYWRISIHFLKRVFKKWFILWFLLLVMFLIATLDRWLPLVQSLWQ